MEESPMTRNNKRRDDMRTIVEDGTSDEFEALLGKQVILFCMNYFYAGKLIGVSDEVLRLEDGGIVYETGDFKDDKWADFHNIGGVVRVCRSTVEAFAEGK